MIRSFLLPVVIIGIVLLASACSNSAPPVKCTDTIGCVHIAANGPIKIGVLQALSGKVAPLGVEQIRGLELALDTRNGTLKGHPVVLHTEDTGCTGEGGGNSVLKIIADPQIVAIFGTTCSGAARTVSKAMSAAGLTMISGNNSAPFLTSISGKTAPDWQPGYFRTSSNEEAAGKAAAIYAYKKLGIRKAAAINDGDIYTKGLTQGFSDAFKQLGGDIVLYTSVNKGETQMGPYLTAVLNSDAELLFFPLFQPEGNHILIQARNTKGFQNITLMSDGALIENSFITGVGNAGKGMYFVGPVNPSGPETEKLARAYRMKYNDYPATSYYLSAYDAARLLFSAIETTSFKDSDNNLHIGRQALRDTMYSIKNFPGVCGTMSCNRFGDCVTPSFNVLRLDDPEQGLEGLLSNIQFTYPGTN